MAKGHEGGREASPPGNFVEKNMPGDKIWCILRHNYEKCTCYGVCTELVASGRFSDIP